MTGWLRDYLAYPLQALLAAALYGLLALLPLDAASALGGWLMRSLGPLLPVHRKVGLANLRRALPGKSDAEYHALLRQVWDNLGRVIGEYPHLARITRDRLVVEGGEHLIALRDDGRPGICVSAHSGNWELGSVFANQIGLPLANIYRAPNNPWVDRLVRRARQPFGGQLLRKGSAGAKGLIATLLNGGHLGLLVDQKMNDGIPVPFFGRPAMTAPAVAQLALRYGCPVVPAFVERLAGARFRLVILPPLTLPDTGDRAADVAAAMAIINQTVEDWIRAHPGQWLWLHRRWPKGEV